MMSEFKMKFCKCKHIQLSIVCGLKFNTYNSPQKKNKNKNKTKRGVAV